MAEEVLQECYLKVISGKAEFLEKSSFKTWFFGVVRLTAKEFKRRIFWNRMTVFGERGERALEDNRPAEGESEREAQIQNLLAAVKTLSRRQQEVLDLVFNHELTLREVAEVLSISEGSARQHYERAKGRLREMKVLNAK